MKLKKWHKRAISLSIISAFLSISLFLILSAFKDNIVFFFSPTELLAKEYRSGKDLRLGGVIKENSVHTADDVLQFTITDFEKEIVVEYKGSIPMLFKEGSGTVALGQFRDGKFYAKEILAKHDENYMPKEVADSLKKNSIAKAV